MSQFRKFLLQNCSKPTIFGAPMNGGINNPSFAAAVISNGGVASLTTHLHRFSRIFEIPDSLHVVLSMLISLCLMRLLCPMLLMSQLRVKSC